jgi:hypothetical protein
VVWEDRLFKSTLDIMAQRVDEYGAPVGEPFSMTVEAGDQIRPAVAYLDDVAHYLAVWLAQAEGVHELSGQIAAPNNDPGNVLAGDSILIRSNLSATLDMPRVLANPQFNEFVAVWVEHDTGEGVLYHRVLAQRLLADGSLSGEPAEIVSDTQYIRSLAVAIDSNGDYLLTWEQPQYDECSGIQALQLAHALDTWTDRFPINAGDPCARRPDVSFYPERNEYVIAWLEESDQGGERVMAGWLSPGDTTVSERFALNATPGEHTDNVKVSYVTDSQVIIAVWDRYEAGGWNLYAQSISSNGSIHDFPILVIPNIAFESETKSRPVLTNFGLVAWLSAGRQWIEGTILNEYIWPDAFSISGPP